MKYSLINLFPKDRAQQAVGVGYYTQQMIEHLVKVYGHELIPEEKIDGSTILLVSICTNESIPVLRNVRKKYPDNLIITGGQYAFMFPVCLIYSDYCVVGEGFEALRCKSLEEMKKLKCVAWRGKQELIEPSTFIDWKLVPACQTKQGVYYYWKGTGCRNKCAFCFTSWTKNLQVNDDRRVRAVETAVKKKGSGLILVSNEYDEDVTVKVKDMMLKQFLKTKLPPKMPKLIRLGIEFPTYELRKKYGKAFTDEEFYQALDKARLEGKELNLFFITGLYPLSLIFDLFRNYKTYGTKPNIFVKFTNISFQQYTPIHKERFNINVDHYVYPDFADELKHYLDNYGGWRFRILSTGKPHKALYESAMNHITSEDEYQTARKILNSPTAQDAAGLLLSSGLLNNDFRPLIKFWYQKNKTLEQAFNESASSSHSFINRYFTSGI